MPMRAFPSTIRTNQNENPLSVSVSVRGAPHRKGQPSPTFRRLSHTSTRM